VFKLNYSNLKIYSEIKIHFLKKIILFNKKETKEKYKRKGQKQENGLKPQGKTDKRKQKAENQRIQKKLHRNTEKR
jgi:hypothetical protein